MSFLVFSRFVCPYLRFLLRWPQKSCPRTSRIELLGILHRTQKTNKQKRNERTRHMHAKKNSPCVAAPARLLGCFVWFFTSLLKYFIYPNEEMAQHRSPRKSLQLNRANTPINVDGPMQDVNVSLSFLLLFMPTLRARAHWSHLSLSLLLSVD